MHVNEKSFVAQCVTCGSELHPERAEKYDYCLAPDCQRKNLKSLTLVAVGVMAVRGTHGTLQTAFENELPLIRPLANQIGWNPDNSKLVRHIDQAFSLSPTTLAWIAVGFVAYAAIELIEAVGLWLITRWGEYFAVIATSVFLPLEIYEISEKVTAFRAIALIINIAAVVWLLWTKRLFGLNGGAAAYHAAHDAATLLAVEQAALK